MMNRAVIIWEFLRGRGLSAPAAAGIMGNLKAESNLRPENLQNSFEKKLGFDDGSYTRAVDTGDYADFVHDGAGYGLCQWTFWTRKEGLLRYAREKDVSIGRLDMQLEFMWREMQGYAGLMAALGECTDCAAACDAFMLQYERPADQSEAAREKRRKYAFEYYEEMKGRGDMKRICIDAGHYGLYNRSRAVPEYYESTMAWKLHKMLRAALECCGFEVIVTREKKAEDLALYERGRKAKGCELFISLHSNATGSGDDEGVDRVDIYAPLSGECHDLAAQLGARIAAVMGVKQGSFVKTRRGKSGGEYYGVLRGAASVNVPGLLVEHSFHTHRESALWLMEDENLQRLAKAEAEVIAKYFGLAEPETPPKLGDRSLVRGDTGADVKALKEELTALGFATEKFGAETEAMVNAFKEKFGMEPNGKAGGGVFRKIRELKDGD